MSTERPEWCFTARDAKRTSLSSSIDATRKFGPDLRGVESNKLNLVLLFKTESDENQPSVGFREHEAQESALVFAHHEAGRGRVADQARFFRSSRTLLSRLVFLSLQARIHDKSNNTNK